MASNILIGTAAGLWRLAGDDVHPIEPLAGRAITALAHEADRTWAIVDGGTLWSGDEAWTLRATIDGLPGTCVATTAAGPLVGTEQAHLFRLAGDRLARLESFETAEGREAWHQPWGDPADVRSIAVTRDGAVHVNVHVGGVVRSREDGASWTPTVDIEVDVHQVLAHPEHARTVLLATAEGFGLSRDGGDTYQFATAGLHAHYLRAVAVAGEHVVISASAGFHGRRSALYRRPLEGATRFERCESGLPKWFDDNIDTGCLAAIGSLVVVGTSDGCVYRSTDAGQHWTLTAKGLPAISAVVAG
jgi:hypothetical protein